MTVMLRPRNSLARTWTSPSTPALEAMYGPYVGNDLAMTLEENMMMRPPAEVWRAACARTTNEPRKFVAITLSKS